MMQPKKTLSFAILFIIACGFVLPFTYRRPGEEWRPADRQGKPLSLEDRFLQSNTDQTGWVRLIADFPGHYFSDNTRINRPIFPFLSSIFCKGIQYGVAFGLEGQVSDHITCSVPIAFGSALIVNWIILTGSVFGFYYYLRNKWCLSNFVSLTSAAQLALSPLVLWHINEASPNLTSVSFPIITLWLFTITWQQEDKRREIFWAGITGLITGLLMLIKMQYDVLVIGWIVMLFFRKYMSTTIAFVFHFVPLFAWIGILQAWGLEYYNLEIQHANQGFWLFNDFMFWGIKSQLAYVFSYSLDYFLNFIRAFGPVAVIMAFIGGMKRMKERFRDWYSFVFITILINYGFLFAIHRPRNYLIALAYLIIYPACAIMLDHITRENSLSVRSSFFIFLLIQTVSAWWLFSI